MKDQADTLRKLMEQRKGMENLPSVPVVTVSSGKGGVGKSSLTANLGTALARSGLRVLLIDGDFGLANLDIILGVHAGATVEEVLDGKATLQDAILGVEPNLWLIPASAGLFQLRRAEEVVRDRMISLFENCPWEMDLILVDVGAGIQKNVLSMHSPAYQSVVVLTPEPTSLTDGYSLIKLLRRQSAVTQVGVIVNQVTGAEEGRVTFKKLKDVASRFIDVEIEYLGHCVRDEKFSQAVMNRKILLDLDGEAPSLPCIELLAKRLRSKCLGNREIRGGTAKGMVRSRIQDEPAQSAPGNTARFLRTLLGEVKA